MSTVETDHRLAGAGPALDDQELLGVAKPTARARRWPSV